MKYVNKIIFLWLYVSVLIGCTENKTHTVLELFSESYPLSIMEEWCVNEDSLAVIEGLICDGENLIVNDYHLGDSYTLFDVKSGEHIARFGAIGQGPDEIPLGCYGYLSKKYFFVFSDRIKTIMNYSLDSLRSCKVNGSPMRLAKYNIPNMEISRLIAIDDSTFVGSGTYESRYQYLLFDKNSRVLDYGIDVYNSTDSLFDIYTRYLANQGDLVMNPKKKEFASSVNFSSNIDFFEIVNNKIKVKKSLRLGDPISKPFVGGGGTIFSVDLTEDTQIGYINLSATTQYVYALYSDKKVYEASRKSNIVLVFDWNGNPVKKYVLDTDAYYIAVDEVQQNIYAAVKNSESGWSIVCYSL